MGNTAVNTRYATVILVSCLVLPIGSAIAEAVMRAQQLSFELVAKWFIFSAVGLRLLVAGIKQVYDPAFTARQIFQIEHADALPVVRELGFANICFGLVGVLSLWLPAWRPVSAFASGLYFGIAGFQHLIKKPVGGNEWLALLSDFLIFLVLAIYGVAYWH